jgi:hypothetical protein
VAKHLLSARAVQLAGPGDHSDGEGLLLHIDERRSHWVLRYTSPGGRRRELGLGRADRTSLAASGRSLTDAREAADAARRLLRAGRDPIDEKHAARAAARKGEAERKAEIRRERTTLARVARGYHERVIEPRRTTTHAREWIGSLERHVPKGLWHKPIDRIEAPELLDAVARVTMKYPETGRRVRQRLELIFADAEFHKLCTGNPGRAIREKVREQCGGRRTQSYRALGYREVPAFMKRLRAVPGISARALEFGLLTVARTGEIRGARWSEIDFASKTWTVPAERMKARQPHLVRCPIARSKFSKGSAASVRSTCFRACAAKARRCRPWRCWSACAGSTSPRRPLCTDSAGRVSQPGPTKVPERARRSSRRAWRTRKPIASRPPTIGASTTRPGDASCKRGPIS